MSKGLLVIAVAAGAMSLAGCAESPESIAPAYVSTVTYQNWTCEQLGEEEARLNQAYMAAAQQQHNARTNDTWGVVLLGLPTASLSGENIAPQIANLKGQLTAVHQSQTLRNCRTGGR